MFNKNELKSMGWMLFKMAFVILLIMFAVVFVINSALPSKTEYKATEMSLPSRGTQAYAGVEVLKRLNNPETYTVAKDFGPCIGIWTAHTQALQKEAEKNWQDAGALDRGSEYYHFIELSRKTTETHTHELSNTIGYSDLFLRNLVRKGYEYRIHWPSIKYIGHTEVNPDFGVNRKLITLYFMDQGRIFSIMYTALTYTVDGEEVVGVIFDEPKNKNTLDFQLVDSGSSGLGDYIKTLLQRAFN